MRKVLVYILQTVIFTFFVLLVTVPDLFEEGSSSTIRRGGTNCDFPDHGVIQNYVDPCLNCDKFPEVPAA